MEQRTIAVTPAGLCAEMERLRGERQAALAAEAFGEAARLEAALRFVEDLYFELDY